MSDIEPNFFLRDSVKKNSKMYQEQGLLSQQKGANTTLTTWRQ
jgi:hypothetical protein